MGINIDKNASSFEALNVLQQKYAGAAEAYGRTAAGSIDRFRVALENAQEEIGTALLPTITEITTATANWLNKPQNIDRLQNDAESLARAFGAVAGAVEKTGYYLDILTGKKMPASLERFLDRWDAFRFDATFGLFGKQSPLPGVQTLPGLRKAPAGAFNVGIDPLAGLGDFVVGPNGTLVRRGAGSSRRGASNLTRTPFLANLLAQAEGTSGRRDNENVLRRIIGALSGRLGRTSNLAARTDLLNSINQYRDQLAGLLADDAQAVKDAADRVKQRRQNARNAAAEALQRLHDALQKQEDAQKSAAQALIDQAGKFKSAILERLQQNRTAVLNRRALADAQEQLRLAREIGGVSGIRAAQRGVEDARFDILRARLDRAPVSLTGGGQLAVGNVVTINVHGVTNPDVVATKVLEAMKRKGRHTTAQTRGPAAGLPHGV